MAMQYCVKIALGFADASYVLGWVDCSNMVVYS